MSIFFHVFLIFMTLSELLLADQDSLQPKYKPEAEDHITQSNLTAGPNAFVHDMVNVITGDLVEHDVDLILDRPNPLIFERSYSSSFDDHGTLTYGWNLNHFTTLKVSTYTKQPKVGTKINQVPKLRAYLNEG